MSNKFSYTILVASVIVFLTIASSALAEITNITYPISELGNCNSQKECTDFCDQPLNHMVCVSWAESEGVFSSQEAKRMKDINRMQEQAEGNYIDDPIFGPGNCITPTECDTYCRQDEHMNECLQFSVNNGYMTSDEADRIMAKRDKEGPGGCKDPEECDAFCSNPDNMDVCMDFVVEEGNITREDADFMIKEARMDQRPMQRPISPGTDNIDVNVMDVDREKVLQILSTEEGPGGCKTLDECADFCNDISRSEECMAFAKKHQLISQERIDRADKMMNMEGPGGCEGPVECNAYCDQEEHMDECFGFIKQNDLMDPIDIDRMEKSIDLKKRIDIEGGPGGCKGPEECDVYCKQEEHREECMDFSVDAGMITQEDRQRMEIIEEKMIMRVDRNMEENMMQNEVRQDNMISPDGNQDYNQMFPPDGGMSPDGQMPPEGDIYYDNMFPPDGEMYNDNMMPPKEGEYYNGGMSPDDKMMPSDDGKYYNGEMPPEGDMYYDNTMPPSDNGEMPPEGDMYDEKIMLEDESVSHSEGLFNSLFNQVRNLLAAIGLFAE